MEFQQDRFNRYHEYNKDPLSPILARLSYELGLVLVRDRLFSLSDQNFTNADIDIGLLVAVESLSSLCY